MSASLIKREEEFIKIYEKYVDMVYRICFLYFKNKADTEDAVQNVFLKLFTLNPIFQDENHRKAWLIITSKNMCKNSVKHWWKSKVSFEEGYSTNEIAFMLHMKEATVRSDLYRGRKYLHELLKGGENEE